jgi:hypothetical protein
MSPLESSGGDSRFRYQKYPPSAYCARNWRPVPTVCSKGLKRMATRFSVGQHVQLHPATDRAMVGDRFGRVVKIGRSLVQVEMFKSGHLIRVHPDKLLPMEPAARRVEIDLGRAGSIGKSRQSQK